MTEEHTDWLANSVYGFGFGHTKEQALQAMAQYCHPNDAETVQVDLVEHIGDASVGMGGWNVEEFISGERVEIDAETMRELSEVAIEANRQVEMALDSPESHETIE